MNVDLPTAARTAPAPPAPEPGSVWLVGAGPGDPGLLTLLAVAALAAADIVLYDALVSAEVLALARRGARLVNVGKRAGVRAVSQETISALLVRHARRGLRVVRLKGGDPFIFARGAEEARALARAGIPFRIVPGVTAGIGGPAYAGIPLTARGVNCAVSFVTGHAAGGTLPEGIDWDALARGSDVLVVYMGLGRIAGIATRLTAAGKDPATPAAVVGRATTPEQEVAITTLGALAASGTDIGVRPPAIIVIGEVVALSPVLDWFAPRPAGEPAPGPLPARAAG